MQKTENQTQIRNSYYLLFAILNGAILMNFHKYIFKNPIAFGAIVLVTFLSILFPKKSFPILINSFLTVYLLGNLYPRIGNHSVILFFTSIVILFLFLFKLFKREFHINPSFLSYFFRVFTVTIYFYTGFHKLNTDYFNTCVSCVNEINEYTLSNVFGFNFKLNNTLSRFFQITALITECLVPLGILFHKTRKYAVFILLLFHSYLSLSVFADFSATGLFLLLGCMIDFENNNFSKETLLFVRIYLLMIIFSILCPLILIKTTVLPSQYPFIKGVFFLSGYLSFIIYFFRKFDTKVYVYQKRYFSPLAILFLMISFWTLKSYIGLGNAGNLTMFSNLVTEKKMSNHLLINTEKTKLFNFEEDNVYIIKLENPYVKENYNGFKIPVVEFRYLVNYWSKNIEKPIPCELVYKNKTYKFKDLKTSEFHNTKWWYRYLNFRKIQTTSPNECRW